MMVTHSGNKMKGVQGQEEGCFERCQGLGSSRVSGTGRG